MSKIFITAIPLKSGEVIGFAMAEDGTGIAEHMSSSMIWLRRDMGLHGTKKHDLYNRYYPDGYTLVDYIDATDEELGADDEYMNALRLNAQEDSDALDSEAREQGEGIEDGQALSKNEEQEQASPNEGTS